MKRIDRTHQKVSLTSGDRLSYDRLLIATGAAARTTAIPGSELPGVVKLDNFSDAQHIIQLARTAKSAVVVGGGITALEIVEGLCARGLKVHYFLRGDRYWSNVLEETESRIIETRLREEGVQIHYRTELEEILGKSTGLFGRNGTRVGGVRTRDNQMVACDIVAVAIGIVPRIDLAKYAGLETDRGVLVDEHLLSSDPNIFAAGDVAQVIDLRTGKRVINSLWGPARAQGRVAGLNMTGKKEIYQKIIPFNVTRLAGLTTTIIGTIGVPEAGDDTIGIVRGESETWREIPDAISSQSGFDVNRIRLLVGENTLLGGILIGDQTLSQAVHQIVLQQIDIRPIRSKLLESGARVDEILANFWAESAYQTIKK